MIEPSTLLQTEATQNEYIFNFVLMNIIFAFTYLNRKSPYVGHMGWLLLLVFCLFAYWDTDFFTFRETFYTELKDFRDPLYYYIGEISLGSYTIFRLLIWGTALYLFKKTLNRFEISQNIAAYIFAVFFLLTFSYARVSLGMAMYFYGLSFLIRPSQNSRFWGIIWGLIFVGCSYYGHRSLMVLILLTPLSLIKLDKKSFFVIAVIGMVFSGLAATLLSEIIAGTLILSDDFGGAGEAAEQYANIEIEQEYNWKFELMRNLRFWSFYVALAYIVWKIAFSHDSRLISDGIKRLATLCLGILIFSVSFLMLPSWGAEAIGYRYLFMLGIPTCVILSYLATREYCKPRTLLFILLLALLYAEGFIFGKILSF